MHIRWCEADLGTIFMQDIEHASIDESLCKLCSSPSHNRFVGRIAEDPKKVAGDFIKLEAPDKRDDDQSFFEVAMSVSRITSDKV